MPGRHSLFWRLAALVAGFCLLLIAATNYASRRIEHETSLLSAEARSLLQGYAAEARLALAGGPQLLAQWQQTMRQRESGWLTLVDDELRSLDGQQYDEDQRHQLRHLRNPDGPMSRRMPHLPLLGIPLDAAGNQLVMQLPERFLPWQHQALLVGLLIYLLPALLSILFCVLLYALLISPLERLRRQADALRGNDFAALLPAQLASRRDELGELGRALDYFARRLGDSVAQQQQLLRDLSHELRTPLSRLRVACESELSRSELGERVEREVGGMQQLVDNTLQLAWLDSEHPQFDREPVEVAALWDVLAEDACFESGWSAERIQSDLPEDCRVLGNLNALAQAMENILRNAIRHSPPDGVVRLRAEPRGRHNWLLCIEDQGPGVPQEQLARIFQPFSRLNAARPGGDGFGLGLAIASRMVSMQGGRIWAENARPGLRLCIRLQSV